jgi:hypothetical protein
VTGSAAVAYTTTMARHRTGCKCLDGVSLRWIPRLGRNQQRRIKASALYDLSSEDAAAHTKGGEMTARAEKLADEAIDRLLSQSDQPKAVKAKRKKRLTKLPAELK